MKPPVAVTVIEHCLKSPIADSFEAAADYYASSNPPLDSAKGQGMESEWSIESAKRESARVH